MNVNDKIQQIIEKQYVDGVYVGNSSRTITIYGEVHKIDAIAKEVGIELPDAKKGKKQVNITEDIQETENADMEQPQQLRDSKKS